MQEKALGRLLLIGLAVIPLPPVCLQAQNCLGFASFTSKPYQFTQRMAFSRDALLGVWATFRSGRRAYGEVEVGTLLDPGNDDTYPNYRELTLGGGYELTRGRTLFFCPVARIGAFATSGKYDPSHHVFAIAAGLSAGLKLGNDPDAHQVVSMGLRLDHRRSKIVLGPIGCACEDPDLQPPRPPGVAKWANYAVLSAGASFTSGGVTARPSTTLPVRVGPPSFGYCSWRPASDCYAYGPMLDTPSISLEVAVSFGHPL
jgi:hypothetical protein